MQQFDLRTSIRSHLDIPIGDPFGYGQPNMPFILGAAAGIGSVAAIGTAVGVAATVTAVAATVAVACTAISLVMTVVGLATGDKDLLKVAGYIGIAGAVTGVGALAGGAAAGAASGAAAAAAPAASGGAGAVGGASAATTSTAAAAITPELSSIAAPLATPAITAPVASNTITGGLGTLGEAGAAAMESTLPAATAGGLGANLGATAPAAIGSQAGDFFSGITGPQMLDIGKAGAGMLSAGATYQGNNRFMENQEAQTEIKRQQQLDDQRRKDVQAQNANTQGHLNMSARPLTPAEIEQKRIQDAEQARRTAGILTGVNK